MRELNKVAIERPERSFARDVKGIAEIIDAIAEPRETIERTFLDTGERLIDAVKLLGVVSAAHEAVAAEFQENDFPGVVRRVRALRDEVARLAGTLGDEDAEIGQLANMTHCLRNPLQDLDDAVKMQGIVTVNARVVLAGIDAPHEDFAAFIAEMSEMGRRSRETVGSILKTLNRVSQMAAKAKQTSFAYHSELATTRAKILERLNADLATIELQQSRAAAHATRSGKLTTDIGTRIAEAVAAMQIGDRTRQRLEHIETILGMVEDLSGEDDTEAVILNLAAAQFASTEEDFATEVGALLSALEGTRRDAQAVLAEGRARADEILTDGSHALTALAKNLQSIAPLLEQEAEMGLAACKLSEETADAAQEMLGQMDVIEATGREVQHLRLNMAIRCVRLGQDARGMSVIADEFGVIAKSASSAAAAMRELLDAFKTIVEALRSQASCSDLHEIEGDPMAAATLLEEIFRRVKHQAASLTKAGLKAIGILNEATERVRDYVESEERWSDLVFQLFEVAGGHDLTTLTFDPARLSEIRSLYTMQVERRVHDDICGTVAPQSDLADEQEAAEDNLESLLF